MASSSSLIGARQLNVMIASGAARLVTRLQWRVELPCGGLTTAVGVGKSGRAASLTNALSSAIMVESPSCSGIQSYTGGIPMALVKIDFGSECVPFRGGS